MWEIDATHYSGWSGNGKERTSDQKGRRSTSARTSGVAEEAKEPEERKKVCVVDGMMLAPSELRLGIDAGLQFEGSGCKWLWMCMCLSVTLSLAELCLSLPLPSDVLQRPSSLELMLVPQCFPCSLTWPARASLSPVINALRMSFFVRPVLRPIRGRRQQEQQS